MSNLISVIVPVYNREKELYELLDSFAKQSDKDFELLIIDDGSTQNLINTVSEFKNKLSLLYFRKKNSGPGLSRNYGGKKANGSWLVFVDSDVIVDKNYIKNIKSEIDTQKCDAFGGADKAHKEFSPIQKAISYSMTSFLTTGGIRGNKNPVSKFQPRSFNMGIKKEIFEKIGGFSDLRIGEDPDLAMTLWEKGYTTAFFDTIAVNHKRRINFVKFSKQIYEFGCARPILNQKHPSYTKASYAIPSLFLLGFLLGTTEYWTVGKTGLLLLYGIYSVLIICHASVKNRSLYIGLLSGITTHIQMFSYGWGFLLSWYRLNIKKLDPKEAFPHHFYIKNDS
ncbi:MAG: glycosyltransferase [Bergeyella sp.]|nr:glycosyltransferase [Bergeyella sp.]